MRTEVEEIRCSCRKKFGVKTRGKYILHLPGKFRVEVQLELTSPGALQAFCDACGSTSNI